MNPRNRRHIREIPPQNGRLFQVATLLFGVTITGIGIIAYAPFLVHGGLAIAGGALLLMVTREVLVARCQQLDQLLERMDDPQAESGR